TPACGPLVRRTLLVTGPGPASGSSRQFRHAWLHEPDKSGMGAVDAAACPRCGAATADITSERRFRSRVMALCFHRKAYRTLHPLCRRLEDLALLRRGFGQRERSVPPAAKQVN